MKPLDEASRPAIWLEKKKLTARSSIVGTRLGKIENATVDFVLWAEVPTGLGVRVVDEEFVDSGSARARNFLSTP